MPARQGKIELHDFMTVMGNYKNCSLDMELLQQAFRVRTSAERAHAVTGISRTTVIRIAQTGRETEIGQTERRLAEGVRY